MIICKAPFRVSLFGGGSDHPSFIDKYGYGLVISFAINKYCYVSVKELMPFFPYKSRITYSDIETVDDNKDIRHKVFKNCIDYYLLNDKPLEVNYTADLPGSIGLGTSSTMVVCMLEAFRQYIYNSPFTSKPDLWKSSSYVERILMKETVGYQDYLPAIYGGCHSYTITHTSIEPFPLNLLRKKINHYGLLFYLGSTRNSSATLSQYIDKIAEEKAQFEIFQIAKHTLEEKNIQNLGVMLTESWLLKKSLSPAVSNEKIDSVVNIVLDEGAYGAKLCGSGGGGCIFVLAHPSSHYNIVEAVKEAGVIQIPFNVAKRGVERIL